ncbi:unnamed protein product [Paramecium sonneborni]|uniref:Uncharacterized protein n=1 Tax=Paramecium sonneborni TaxID=65129 RepID=A0A8S1KFP9_9CILI|nr:unnamed protein product [Paramecium sonneborni]
MENFQNITKSQAATYRFFVRKTQIRQENDQNKGFPIYGHKMNIQQQPRLNYPIKFQISIDKQQKIKSNSVKNDQSQILKKTQNRCQIYEQYMNEIVKKRRNLKISLVEQRSYTNQHNKQGLTPFQECNIIVPKQLIQERKQKKQILQKQIIIEPSIIEDLKPWESGHNSIAYFQ